MSHSRLSPSSAHRWVTCPGSLTLCEPYPDSPSKVADEGTLAHYLAEVCLLGELDPSWYVGARFDIIEGVVNLSDNGTYTVTDEMVGHVGDYIDYVQANCPNGYEVESRLDLSGITGEETFGTADIVSVDHENRVIQIIDLKYGMGKVEIDNNYQLMMYALGAYYNLGELVGYNFRLHIYQPRINNYGYQDLTLTELFEFEKLVKRSLTSCDYNPTEKACQWCKAKGECKALANKVAATIVGEFNDLSTIGNSLPDAIAKLPTITNYELGALKSDVPLIKLWIDAVENKVFSELLAGRQVLGFKLVKGRDGNRTWVVGAEDTIVDMLKEDAYTKSLVSPAVAEKLVKKAKGDITMIEKLTTRPEGRPTVVPVSDKRKPIDLGEVISEFDDLTV